MSTSTSSESPSKDMRIDVIPYIGESLPITKYLPELAQYKSFVGYEERPIDGLPADKVIAYIVILYSSDSLLNGHPMPPLNERMERAAELCGFKKTKKGFAEQVTKMLFPLNDGNDQLLDMVFEFLIRQNNLEWEEIVAIERLRYNYLRSMVDNSGLDDPNKLKHKSTLKHDVMAMSSELKRMYSELFEKNDDLIALARDAVTRDFIEDRAK